MIDIHAPMSDPNNMLQIIAFCLGVPLLAAALGLQSWRRLKYGNMPEHDPVGAAIYTLVGHIALPLQAAGLLLIAALGYQTVIESNGIYIAGCAILIGLSAMSTAQSFQMHGLLVQLEDQHLPGKGPLSQRPILKKLAFLAALSPAIAGILALAVITFR